MADDLDPALTGAAFDLANAGYAAMPDKERKDEDERLSAATALPCVRPQSRFRSRSAQ